MFLRNHFLNRSDSGYRKATMLTVNSDKSVLETMVRDNNAHDSGTLLESIQNLHFHKNDLSFKTINSNWISTAAEFEVTNSASEISLTGIFVYPIKSCRGISVSHWVLLSEGLLYDREWAVINTNTKKATTQKTHPKLNLLQPSFYIKCSKDHRLVDLIAIAGGRGVDRVVDINDKSSDTDAHLARACYRLDDIMQLSDSSMELIKVIFSAADVDILVVVEVLPPFKYPKPLVLSVRYSSYDGSNCAVADGPNRVIKVCGMERTAASRAFPIEKSAESVAMSQPFSKTFDNVADEFLITSTEEEANAWLTTFINDGQNYSLVRRLDSQTIENKQSSSFKNDAALLLLSEESISELKKVLSVVTVTLDSS